MENLSTEIFFVKMQVPNIYTHTHTHMKMCLLKGHNLSIGYISKVPFNENVSIKIIKSVF